MILSPFRGTIGHEDKVHLPTGTDSSQGKKMALTLIQFLLLMTATFHASLGIRVILLDFNLVNVKYQKFLIYGLLGLGLIVFVIIWKSIY